MDNNKVLKLLVQEHRKKREEMDNDFSDKLMHFDNDDWNERELIAYDLGFTEALMIIIKILEENGVE